MLDRQINNNPETSDASAGDPSDESNPAQEVHRASDGNVVALTGDAILNVAYDTENAQIKRAEALVADAIAELRRIEADLSFDEASRQKKLSGFLSRVYIASMRGKDDKKLHESLIAESGIETQKNTPHHKKTLRAILRMARVDVEKQTEHEYYLVVDGLDAAKVQRSEEAVLHFLSETVEINGQKVSGFRRAKAVRPQKSRVTTARARAKNAKNNSEDSAKDDAAQQMAYQAIIQKVEQNRIGAIDIVGTDEAEDGVWLSVNRGRDILLKLKVSAEHLRALVVEHADQNCSETA